ncbi:cation/calcium exchanger 5-like [Chenopodium quinoa]|uniref:cation/calcium exchanger 5-like n=1 Tax=Chenopodium quinoa TaxID=63459 RepID=UPI000B790F38|nr:cation/calcium exchanger 5-like [Chenopodium quinoa]
MAIISLQTLHSSTLTLFILLTLLFFFLTTPFSLSSPSHRSLLSTPTSKRCSILSINGGFLNYLSLHSCIFPSNPIFSLLILFLTLLLHFYILIKTAQTRFSIIVTTLSSHLSLSPSMAAVTLLALGNGAPDVFASVAAVAGGETRTGFGAILSAGTFVSAFVVGFVGIYAAPFCVDPSSFVRDVLFYLMAAFLLFYVYLSGELYFWQAFGFVLFYLFFVGFVFWMDFGSGSKKVVDFEAQKSVEMMDSEKGDHHVHEIHSGVFPDLKKISKIWETPVSLLLKLTIPQTSPSEWSRFYQSANIALCPLALLYSCKSFMPMSHPVIFLIPHMHLPLWSVVLFSSSSLAILHYIVEKEPPKTEQIHVVLVAFVMSVFWISNVAGELLNCLGALGKILNLPPSILGLTVLAWGNSVGDLVADVAVAKAGQPALAMAGCFAGPMFNMLIGLGTALMIQTAKFYPEPYVLHFHVSIVIAFVFLFLSLMGSLLVVTWSRFRVPRFWGFCLVGLYVLFIFVSLVIANFTA